MFQCSEFLLAGQINFPKLKINVSLAVCSSEKSSSEKRSVFVVNSQTYFFPPSFCVSLELLYCLPVWPASHPQQQVKDTSLVCFIIFLTTFVFTSPSYVHLSGCLHGPLKPGRGTPPSPWLHPGKAQVGYGSACHGNQPFKVLGSHSLMGAPLHPRELCFRHIAHSWAPASLQDPRPLPGPASWFEPRKRWGRQAFHGWGQLARLVGSSPPWQTQPKCHPWSRNRS